MWRIGGIKDVLLQPTQKTEKDQTGFWFKIPDMNNPDGKLV